MLVQVLQTYNGRRGQLFFYRTPFPRRRIPFSGDGGSPRFFGCAEKPLRREKLGRNNFCRRPVSFWPPFSFLFRFFLFGLAWKNCSTPTQKMWRPIRQSTRIPFPFLDLSFFLRAHSSSSSFSSSSSSFFFFHRLSVSSYAAPTPNAMDAQECVVSFFQQFVTVISHCSFCDQRNTR